MNIFKILANGDGTINEANISAFLGYLLDPYQDHGLGYEFLHRFINKIEKLGEEKNIFKTAQYDYEILFEQAFRDDNKSIKKKEIVDIVILCFENSQGKGKESIATSIIQNVRELKYIFLIENKVNVGAKAQHQLKNQYDNTLATLKIDNSKVVSIYVTPDDSNYIDEFNSFIDNDKKQHIIWISDIEKPNQEDEIETSENGNILSIYSILKDILSDESKGKIEAINEYTKHTIISFMKFIDNDFKSQIIEKKEIKEGKFQKDISHTVEEHLSKYKDQLNEKSNQFLTDISTYLKEQYPKYFYRHTKTHPLSVLANETSGKLFGLTRYGKNLKLHFILRNFVDPTISTNLKKILIENKLQIVEEDRKIDVYQQVDLETLKIILKQYLNLIANATTNN